MRSYVFTAFLFLIPMILWGQGRGFGYSLDMGGSAWSQPVNEYDQGIAAITHNVFMRKHNKSGNRAFQLMLGHKTQSVSFLNYSAFLAPDGEDMLYYDTDASIKSTAWRFAMIEQFQFGRRPGRFMISLNPGLFYERTMEARRVGTYDGITYALGKEINPRNFGYTMGAEVRFTFLTFGYKVERLFWDVLDHDYILSQELSLSNSSELRGLSMNPMMHYFYMGVNIDFFRKKKDD